MDNNYANYGFDNQFRLVPYYRFLQKYSRSIFLTQNPFVQIDDTRRTVQTQRSTPTKCHLDNRTSYPPEYRTGTYYRPLSQI